MNLSMNMDMKSAEPQWRNKDKRKWKYIDCLDLRPRKYKIHYETVLALLAQKLSFELAMSTFEMRREKCPTSGDWCFYFSIIQSKSLEPLFLKFKIINLKNFICYLT